MSKVELSVECVQELLAQFTKRDNCWKTAEESPAYEEARNAIEKFGVEQSPLGLPWSLSSDGSYVQDMQGMMLIEDANLEQCKLIAQAPKLADRLVNCNKWLRVQGYLSAAEENDVVLQDAGWTKADAD